MLRWSACYNSIVAELNDKKPKEALDLCEKACLEQKLPVFDGAGLMIQAVRQAKEKDKLDFGLRVYDIFKKIVLENPSTAVTINSFLSTLRDAVSESSQDVVRLRVVNFQEPKLLVSSFAYEAA